MKKIVAVIGARPQFIKHFAIDHYSRGVIDLKTIHTGQHYDANMSSIFFDELKMSKPDYLLNTGGGTHGKQTGKMLIEIEKILSIENPNYVVVYGDTNSTLAGALAAAKLHIPIAHIEAGVRSYNKKLPEEINRLLTDHLATLFFVPSEKAKNDLLKEGIHENIYNVGDVMKDVLDYAQNNQLFTTIDINEPFYYATIHRPYNTDDRGKLIMLLNALNGLDKKVIFAIHPRTTARMEQYQMQMNDYPNILFISPQSYISNLSYVNLASAVLTDSGGIQKEAYWLKTKCITIRSETEWVETLENGWNRLCFENLEIELQNSLNMPVGEYKELYCIPNTSEKIIEIISNQN